MLSPNFLSNLKNKKVSNTFYEFFIYQVGASYLKFSLSQKLAICMIIYPSPNTLLKNVKTLPWSGSCFHSIHYR